MAKSKTFKQIKRKILHSRFVTAIIVQIAYWYTLLVARTSRWEKRGVDSIEKLWRSGQNTIALGWHGRALMLPLFKIKEITVEALVSPHNDGRLIAGVLKKWGINTIDGSSNNNASGSAINLMRSLKKKHTIAIIPDGPRGPRMKLGMSPIYFAQKTGVPIVAVCYSTKKAKLITKSWDCMMIPKPFSKGILIMSEPIYVPKDLAQNKLEEYRALVEKTMIDIQNEADEYTSIPRVLPTTHVKTKRHAKQE